MIPDLNDPDAAAVLVCPALYEPKYPEVAAVCFY
jgi:hypothetical protein